MLIAEDLLLLLLDDESGRLESTNLDAALGGALLVELALMGAVEVRKGDGIWARSKVHVRMDHPLPEDPVLAIALDQVAQRERTAQDLVTRLGKKLSDELLPRLAEKGIVERHDEKVLGLFPRTRWPALDSRHEEEVRRRLSDAVVAGAAPDERTAALISLVHAIDKAHKVVDARGLGRGEVRKRAKGIADGDWAAKAVKDAVSAAQGAMIAAVAAGGAAAGSS